MYAVRNRPKPHYLLQGVIAGVLLGVINATIMLVLAVAVNSAAAAAFLPILGWTTAVSFFAIITDLGACIMGGVIGSALYSGIFHHDRNIREKMPRKGENLKFPHNIWAGVRAVFAPTLPLEFFMVITYFIVGIASLFVGQTWMPVICYGFQVLIYVLNGMFAGWHQNTTFLKTP